MMPEPLTTHELKALLESDRMLTFWREIERIETRFKSPLRQAADPKWFLVDDIFSELKAIPRRLGEK